MESIDGDNYTLLLGGTNSQFVQIGYPVRISVVSNGDYNRNVVFYLISDGDDWVYFNWFSASSDDFDFKSEGNHIIRCL